MPRHTDCLVVHESTLREIARLLGTEYLPGSFPEAMDEVQGPDTPESRWEVDWRLAGPRGTYTVRLERWEGYLWCTLVAEPPVFEQVVALMQRDGSRQRRPVAEGGRGEQ